MASLGFEDTEKALRMHFEGRLGDDIPKPRHRDGRIVEFTSKGRRRLEHVTPEDVVYALTRVRVYNERAHKLIVARYRDGANLEELATNFLIPVEEVAKLVGEGLKLIAYHAVYSDDCMVR